MTAGPATRPSLSENPWFWLMLFGAFGVAGMVVIAPKHARRQARIERMAEARVHVTVGPGGMPTTQTNNASPNGESPYTADDAERPPRLGWLLGLTTALMLVGTAGLLVSRRRARAAAALDAESPDAPTSATHA